MWQVTIGFKDLEDKESLLSNCYLFNLYGIWERESEIVIYFDSEKEMKDFKKSLKDRKILFSRVRDNIRWTSVWKRFHKPVRIKPFFIVPDFSKAKTPEGYKRIIIKPSFAFGTGSHSTTRLCIKFLIKYLKKGMKVLDLGTGTGILAIISEKLGAEDIYAIDIDEVALKEADRNIRKNRCGKIKLSKNIEGVKGYFDLCVCNIVFDELIKLKKHIADILKKGGILILSGLLDNQFEDILDYYKDVFSIIDYKKRSDNNFNWISLVFVKK